MCAFSTGKASIAFVVSGIIKIATPNILTAYRTRISVGDVLTVKNPNGTEAKS